MNSAAAWAGAKRKPKPSAGMIGYIALSFKKLIGISSCFNGIESAYNVLSRILEFRKCSGNYRFGDITLVSFPQQLDKFFAELQAIRFVSLHPGLEHLLISKPPILTLFCVPILYPVFVVTGG